ncbi:hypothetical protein BUALT_Bualt10G0095000 [Buddleja alternifolia]|uniref:Uncharacterized protein n=1 Tax=Buddleja alternifolia TaxID=168488 RepID=A0AAV6WXF9_9LAMI|nr:hypothetical protein BUALT_Bualt10G0095000 [Buddleja alternifolia]
MTELLLNPEKLLIARYELMSVVGENAQVQESDISKLPLLQAVIKEIFRNHPPVPLLIPRKTKINVEVNGRRICPCMPLASRMLHLTVATLVRNFDWKFENGIKSEEVDMKEMFGLSLHKEIPLKAIPLDFMLKIKWISLFNDDFKMY